MPRERVVLVGDSTVASSSGWGDSFAKLLKDDVECVNMGRGGRSSKSYRQEGHWQKVLEAKPTWVLIPFGHNDMPGKGPDRETDAKTTFRENLARYVAEARAVGVKPVLVTSLTRRNFNTDGKIRPEPLNDYVEATRAVAAEQKMPLIDLNARSIEQMNQLGPAAAVAFDAKTKDPSKPDKTHLSAKGADETAKLVADEIRKIVPELAKLLKPVAGEFQFDFGSSKVQAGSTQVMAQTTYDEKRGFGFLRREAATPDQPSAFAVNVDEGNYEVTIRFGDTANATSTTIKVESRRLMIERVETTPGQFETRTFTVNVRKPSISTGGTTSLNSRELGPPATPDWDDHLTFEFNGQRPGVASIEIKPARDAITVFLAGDSTVTDQRHEPYAGWGQMLPRFFGRGVAISNQAESGLALFSFERQKRLDKIMSMMKPGDYLFIQFGHNDQKDKRADAGPFTTYKANLQRFVAAARSKGGIPVLVTPMERRCFDKDGKLTTTLADYAESVRQVGTAEKVPVIDLHVMSLKFYAALGPEKSTKAFAHYPANTFPGQDKPLKDDTHHNNYGGYELARCVVEGIKSNVPALAAHLAKDAGSFDPSNPDEPDKVEIPASSVVGATEKPTGN